MYIIKITRQHEVKTIVATLQKSNDFAIVSLLQCNNFITFSSSENDTHAIMNDIVYIDHMKIADVPASPS
jgi:hypothetical protein